VSGFPVTGKADIDVAVAGYTVTFDANGGEFADGDGTMTMTAPENGTLTLPENETLTPPPPTTLGEYQFDGWHSAGEPFTAGTPVSGDITVSAKWLSPLDLIAAYLDSADGGDTPANPVSLAISLDLGSGGLADILSTYR
jgi:hypothetical protein